jgi:hypothetical protein
VYLFSLCVVSLLFSRFSVSALVCFSNFLKYSMRQNILAYSKAHVRLSSGHSSSRTCSQCVVQMLEMDLSTEEKVFIVEYYFCSYGSSRDGRSSLKKVTKLFRERFNKMAPSNTFMLSIFTIDLGKGTRRQQ